jgi:hypothetical protein
MAQDLTVNIKTTSDVPQAMDKAKSATVSFGKQVDDIQKKFGTGFKDIFLRFLAPMALVNAAIQSIQASFEKQRQNMAEALAFAELGESKFISAEARYLAAEKKRRDAEGSRGKAQMGEEELIKDFLKNDPRTSEIMKKLSGGTVAGIAQAELRGSLMPGTSGEEQVLAYSVKNLEIRKAVLDIIRSEMGTTPESVKDKTPTATNFKGPEGFGNVVGVGANPVMEAMAEQTEIAKQQLAVLQQIAAGASANQTDFTKNDPHVTGYNGQM